jgi:hypothetical protein
MLLHEDPKSTIIRLLFPTHQYPPDWQELIDSQSQIGWLEYQAQHL